MWHLFLRFFLPLSPEQVADTLVEEARLGLMDTCRFLTRIENKEVFNLIYEKEILELYGNAILFTDLKAKIQQQCAMGREMF